MFEISSYICEKGQVHNSVKFIKIETYHQILYAYEAVISMQYKLSRAFNIYTVCYHPIVLTVSNSLYFFLQPSVRLKRCKHKIHSVFYYTKYIYVYIYIHMTNAYML